MDLAQTVEQLIHERQQHADALARIDQSIFGIVGALTATAGLPPMPPTRSTPPSDSNAFQWMREPKRRGRPPGSRNGTQAAAGPGRNKRTRGSYATTGDESVMAFIRQNKRPTTKEIREHWASEGRKGTADNVLSKLFRERKVKRTPVEDGRGSRYSLA